MAQPNQTIFSGTAGGCAKAILVLMCAIGIMSVLTGEPETQNQQAAAMSLSLLKFVRQASLVDDAMLPS